VVASGGVGIAIKLQGGKIVVTGVRQGSSAERGGIKIADHIISVDGQAVDKKRVSEVQELICGTEGSVLKMHATRASVFWGVPTQIKVDLIRELPG
jgi:C-terminal processing protease CtpA/Prc